ncbi:MAG: endonuclease/exonuclease/phosphatase family protein [Planctomycetales bacterium]
MPTESFDLPDAKSAASTTSVAPRGRRRVLRRIAVGLLLLAAALTALFVVNGTLLSRGETPTVEILSEPSGDAWEDRRPLTVKVLAFNIAKCFAYQEGATFEDVGAVRQRIEEISKLIRAEQPDYVFLSEVLAECGPCPVNQGAEVARATGMHVWAFGENFNFGIPKYRVVGGNAILSRWPIETVGNPSLAGRRPFYVTKNNRRVLWCATRIGGERVLLASIHNDSFNRINNAQQMQQILDFVGDQPAILAGDFNALPEWEAIQLVRESGWFSKPIEEPLTFPSDAPDRRIDYVFAPASWELLDDRVLDNTVSDHRAVVATFRVNQSRNPDAEPSGDNHRN